MTTILAFETSVGNCSVSLRHNSKIFYKESSQKMMQSEELLAMINSLLDESNIEYKDLSAISCSIGPGSFTGIRAGIAAALGMKKALKNAKLIGVSTLDAIAYEIPEEHLKNTKKILVVLRSYGPEFYTQEFSNQKTALSEIKIMKEQEVETAHSEYDLIVSNEILNNVTTVEMNAKSVMQLALHRYEDSNAESSIEPIYIKKPNIHGHN